MTSRVFHAGFHFPTHVPNSSMGLLPPLSEGNPRGRRGGPKDQPSDPMRRCSGPESMWLPPDAGTLASGEMPALRGCDPPYRDFNTAASGGRTRSQCHQEQSRRMENLNLSTLRVSLGPHMYFRLVSAKAQRILQWRLSRHVQWYIQYAGWPSDPKVPFHLGALPNAEPLRNRGDHNSGTAFGPLSRINRS
jgi:hypothetical protein